MVNESKTRHPSKPPIQALERTRALLTARHLEETALQKARRAEAARFQNRFTRILLDHLEPAGDELRQLATARAQTVELRAKRSRAKRPLPGKVVLEDMQMDSSGILDVKVPPYDFGWTSGASPGFERADPETGRYGFDLQVIDGGQQSAAAGVGFWFYSDQAHNMLRVALLLDYYFDWWDMADLAVAHNDASTRLWVFGETEQTWVATSSHTPSWSDGVGWYEDHGNDPGEDGRVACDTYVNTRPQSWYQCWLWSSGNVYGDKEGFHAGASTIHIDNSVRFGVVGSL